MDYRISRRELKKFRRFLEYSGDGKKLLLYHNDPDGICSAVMFLRFFPGFQALPRRGPMISSGFLDELIRKNPGIVIFMDIPVDQESAKIRKLQKETGCKVMIIDHHIYEKNLDSGNILHLNPRFRKKKAYIPASAMIYTILMELGHDVRKLCWMAAMGVIGDYGFVGCEGLIEECGSEYPYLLRGHPLDSKLGIGADMISYAVIMKGLEGAAESLKILMGSLGYEDFAGNRKLRKWKSEMERELDFSIKEAEKESFPELGLDIYRIKTRFNIASLVATRFSEKSPGSVIMVRKKLRDGWKVCMRNQSGRINLGRIAKRCVRGIGSGGGHEKAAGALTTDWDRFRERFVSALRKSVKTGD